MFFFAIFCLFAGSGCTVADRAEPALVTIDTGLGLSKGVSKGVAPSNVSGLTIAVTGTGMEAISETISTSQATQTETLGYDPATGVITLKMDPGEARTFRVTASVDPSDPGVILSYSGSATADVMEGENSVQVEMGISRTKIVVPDYQNKKIVQIDKMVSPFLAELTGIQVAALSETDDFFSEEDFYPYDIDLDSSGRIYIANNCGGSGMGRNRVMRIDNLTGANYKVFQDAGYDYGVVALAVDRKRNYVYYANSSPQLFRSDYNGDNVKSDFQMTDSVNFDISSIRGLAVDDAGMLYIAGLEGVGNSFPAVIKYDTNTETVTDVFHTGDTLWDVTIKSDGVYVTDLHGTDGVKILQFPFDLSSISASSGKDVTAVYPLRNQGEFYGPTRFVGRINQGFYFLDEDFSAGGADAVVFMQDFDGNGWTVYGETGTLEGQFRLFSTGI